MSWKPWADVVSTHVGFPSNPCPATQTIHHSPSGTPGPPYKQPYTAPSPNNNCAPESRDLTSTLTSPHPQPFHVCASAGSAPFRFSMLSLALCRALRVATLIKWRTCPLTSCAHRLFTPFSAHSGHTSAASSTQVSWPSGKNRRSSTATHESASLQWSSDHKQTKLPRPEDHQIFDQRC